MGKIRGGIIHNDKPPPFEVDDLFGKPVAEKFVAIGGNAYQDKFKDVIA